MATYSLQAPVMQAQADVQATSATQHNMAPNTEAAEDMRHAAFDIVRTNRAPGHHASSSLRLCSKFWEYSRLAHWAGACCALLPQPWQDAVLMELMLARQGQNLRSWWHAVQAHRANQLIILSPA
jgi:hypothetical protein